MMPLLSMSAILRICSVMELAFQHEEICEMVHRWLEALAGTPMVRVKCLRLGDPYSAYRIDRLPGKAAARSPRSG